MSQSLSSEQNSRKTGQILVEVIIAAAIVILISTGLVTLISVSLEGIRSMRERTAASFLFQETSEAMRAVTKEDWLNVSNLATSTANHYYPTISGGKWITASGDEIINLNNINYTRFFWVDDVYRSTSTGDIAASGGYWDPSTKKITSRITWTPPDQNQEQTFEQLFYVSRFLNETFGQTDWSGGNVGEQVITAASTTFATSSAIDATSTAGSIKLKQQ